MIEKEFKITGNRKVFTNKEIDYTCIEIFESDGIKNFFKIEPNIFNFQGSNNGRIFEEIDIFVLQFFEDNKITFSDGNIIKIIDNEIIHQASTDKGSSGSPIIKRGKDNYIIGLHKASYKDEDHSFNIGTTFNSILDNIKEQFNEINCIYIPYKDKKEIYLIHDYSTDISYWKSEYNKKIYLEAKEMNKSLIKENIELYINDKKINFNFKYKCQDSKEIKVKFKFKKILTNMSFMFYQCSSLKSLDLSPLNTNQINNMNGMLDGCSSLQSINLSSINTSNVKDMGYMFNCCSSLTFLDLSKFDTGKVNKMNSMFQGCSSLKILDLSSFNTSNVNSMEYMFQGCSSLKALDLSSFITSNVNSMEYMFYRCTFLKSLNLASFNTSNVNNRNNIFDGCSSLKKDNIKINNKEDKILNKL